MSTKVSTPSAPPAPSSRESFEAFRDIQPDLFEQQLQFAPLEAQQQMDLAQQYALPLAQIYRDAQATLYPEMSALNEQLSGQAAIGSEQGLTDAERSQYQDYFRSHLGTNAGSGIGANYMGKSMVAADQQRKDYFRNLGLSLSGRQPLAQPANPQYTNYMQGFQPSTVMGFDAQNYGNFAGAYSSMYGSNAQTGTPFQQWMGGVGGIMGGIGAMGTGLNFGRG